MKKVRVAVIGQGRSGRDIHCKWLQQDRRYQIVAVTDPMKERRERAEQEYGCDTYAKHEALFKRDDLDLIVNASPSDLHVPITEQVLKAGFNCLCEKPAANKAKDVDRLIATAKKHKVVYAVFQQSRFAPYFEKVREVIDSGILGRIVQITISFSGFSRRYDWQTLKEKMGGNLLNTGPHPLDQALQLFGADAMPEVYCHMDKAVSAGNAEDFVVLMLRGADRPLITVNISSVAAYPTPVYRVDGTQGGLTAWMDHAEWRYINPKKPLPRLKRKPLVNEAGLPAYPSESLNWTMKKWQLPKSQADLFAIISKRYYSMLYDTLVEGKPLVVKPEEVRRQIAVIELCQKQNPQIYGK